MIATIITTLGIACMVSTPNLCFKEGVRINGPHLYPEMTQITEMARITAPPTDDGKIWITSANDSRHGDDSLHYKNRAFDLRIYNITGLVQFEAELWAERLALALGEDYDVVKEKDHIHIEWDPDIEDDDGGLDYGSD